ncbi:MAG: hypothetical protein CMH54_03365 [Myxococcales bacterium]|nr:hypothetical protein [Myxococcales bacterium]
MSRSLGWVLCLAYCLTLSPRALPGLPAWNGQAVADWLVHVCDVLGPVISLWMAGSLYRPRMRTSAMGMVTGAWLVLGVATVWMFPIGGMGTSVLGMTCLVYGVVQSQSVGYRAMVTGAGLCFVLMGLPAGRVVAIPLALASCLQVFRGNRGWLYLPGVVVPMVCLGLIHQRITLGTWGWGMPSGMDLSFRLFVKAVLSDPVVILGCVGCMQLRRIGFSSVARGSIQIAMMIALAVALLYPVSGRVVGLWLLLIPLGLGVAVVMDRSAQWQISAIAICSSSILAGFHAARLQSFDWGLRQFWWQPEVTAGWLELVPFFGVLAGLGVVLIKTVLRVHGTGPRAIQFVAALALFVSGVVAVRWAVYL